MQAEYVEDFHGAVITFLAFHPSHADLADRLARAVTDHATPVGSGTVARTLRIPGDWAFGRGGDYHRNARWFRDQIRCRTVHLVWGNHDDRKIADLFASTHHQAEVRDRGVKLTLNHYPMLTWNGQHHATLAEPNVHLYGHVHALYQKTPEASPLKDAAAWPALDVGFDGHDYQVWSLEEILAALRPRLEAFEALKRSRHQSDPFRGRGHRAAGVRHHAEAGCDVRHESDN